MVYFSAYFAIANVFLAYLVGSDKLIQMIEEGPKIIYNNLTILQGFLFYFVWFREQVCIACPYGRLQSVIR
jgi:polyferredoxin